MVSNTYFIFYYNGRKQALPQVAERSPTESGISELVAIIAASKPALSGHFKGIFRNAGSIDFSSHQNNRSNFGPLEEVKMTEAL